MALILVAPLMTVARVILSKGGQQAAKKYGPKLIKEAKNFITKNKLIWDGSKVIKPKPGQIKNIVNKKVSPKTKTTTKSKDTFDEALKKKEGSKVFDTKNQQAEYYAKNFKKTDSTKLPVKKNELVKYYDDAKLAASANKKALADKGIVNKFMPKGKLAAAGAALTATGVVAPFMPKGNDIMSKMFKGYTGSASGTNKKVDKGTSDNTGSKKSVDASSFGEAFRKARKEKGTDSTFVWKGKTYSTVTMDEVKKAGFDNLTQYLNAKKKG